METGVTTIGPVTEETRDRLKNYRDRKGHSNYNAALAALLDSRPSEDKEQ